MPRTPLGMATFDAVRRRNGGHTAARARRDTGRDVSLIHAALGESRDIINDMTRRGPRWYWFSPAAFGGRYLWEMARHLRDQQSATHEFAAEMSRRAAVLAHDAANRSSDWLLDKVHDVDWWSLAEEATSPEGRALIMRLATGAARVPAQVALEALDLVVAYHKDPRRQDAPHRSPSMAGLLVSHVLHRRLKGADFTRGKAATEQILRLAAELRDAKAFPVAR